MSGLVGPNEDAMRTATCFTPDRTFFAPAVRAIASLIAAEPDVEREIFLICEPDDVRRASTGSLPACASASSS